MGRKALVLDEKGPTFDTIPLPGPEASSSHARRTIKWISEEEQNIDWSVELSGAPAWVWTGAERNQSKTALDKSLLAYVATPEETLYFNHSPYDLHSRVTKPLVLGGKACTRLNAVITSAGLGLPMWVDALPSKLAKTDWASRVTRFYLGCPRTMTTETEFTGVRLVGKTLPSCELDTPWMSLSHSIRKTRTGVLEKETMVVKTRYLEPESFRSAAFEGWRQQLKHCVWPWLILEPFPARQGAASPCMNGR